MGRIIQDRVRDTAVSPPHAEDDPGGPRDPRAAHRVVTHPPLYPVNLDLFGEPALVVGGGHVAARKVNGLLEAGAVVTVVAPRLVDALVDLTRDEPALRWFPRPYRRGEAASYRVVVTTTGDRDVDSQVVRDARATGIPVNSADDPANCSFTLPAIVRAGDIQVTVSTAGRSPAMASWLRDRFAGSLDAPMVDALALIASVRSDLRASGISTEVAGWRRALDSGLVDLVAEGHLEQAEALLVAELQRDGLRVGAHPDDPGPEGGLSVPGGRSGSRTNSTTNEEGA